MIHRWFVAFAICITPSLSVAQEPQPAQQPIDAKATTQAIDAGIGWLLRHQDETGGWSASQFVRHDPKTDLCTGTGKPDQDLIVTALATMALFVHGNPEGAGGHRSAEQKAVLWLETQMQDDGFVGVREAGNAVVGHAMSCAVLAAGKLGQRPTRSFECLVALRLPDGTWPARPGETKGDAMATYWACVTCHYCALLFEGARVNLEPTLDAIEKGRLATAPLPSVEAVLRWLAHHEPETDRRLDALMLALGDHVPQWRSGAEAARMDYLDWHAGTNAAWYDCDALWQQWYAALQAALVPHQRTDGAHAGSWDPVDKNGKEGGRVYATAVNVFSLANGQHRDSVGRGGAAKK